MVESRFQSAIKQDLRRLFPGCLVLKLDSSDIQGIPDLLVLYKTKWAMLEVKISKEAKRRPNQEYYIDLCNNMCYASFIYPENKEEVFDELQRAFGA